LTEPHVAPDGALVPCCGGGLVAKGLIAGNAYEKSIGELIATVEQDPIMNSLAMHKGPVGLIKTLEERHPTWKPREHYTGTCHACFEIMNDPSLVEFLRKAYQGKEVDLLLTRLYMEAKGLLFTMERNGTRSESDS
jgi:hypothetical protein